MKTTSTRRGALVPKSRKRNVNDLPTKSPAENLELLSVINGGDYRAFAVLLEWRTGLDWGRLAFDERIKAIEEVDRRRAYMQPKPGERIV